MSYLVIQNFHSLAKILFVVKFHFAANDTSEEEIRGRLNGPFMVQ